LIIHTKKNNIIEINNKSLKNVRLACDDSIHGERQTSSR
jgi:hypothetical protein